VPGEDCTLPHPATQELFFGVAERVWSIGRGHNEVGVAGFDPLDNQTGGRIAGNNRGTGFTNSSRIAFTVQAQFCFPL
jgi:hypothetical protein